MLFNSLTAILTYKKYRPAIFFAIIAVFFFSLGCKRDTKEIIAAVEDRTVIPKLHATDITTIVSDSGITRYRVSASTWDVYDKASAPYWEFIDGILLECFDEDLSVNENIRGNYAHYDERNKIWTLRGSVKATNVEEKLFETELLFWNQQTERIYTDSLITITEPNGRVIIGNNGFNSNQDFTKYDIFNSNAVLPVDEEENDSSNDSKSQ